MRSPAPVHTMVCAVAALVLGSTSAWADTVMVTVEGLRSAKGQILIAVHNTSSSFPSRWSGAIDVARIPASQKQIAATFRDLRPGTYAVIAVHDEDGDGEMSKNLIGLPQEGFGTSNNPLFFGPPRFGSAMFRLDGTASLTIKIKYL